MVPWGTGNPISSGNLDTLVFLTEKPPPLSFSEGGGSMSRKKILSVYFKMKKNYDEQMKIRVLDILLEQKRKYNYLFVKQ